MYSVIASLSHDLFYSNFSTYNEQHFLTADQLKVIPYGSSLIMILLYLIFTLYFLAALKKISRWLHKRKKTKQNAVNTHRVLVITMKLILAFRITQTCNYNRCLTMVGDGRLLYPHLYPKNWIWNKLLWRWWEKEFEKAVITTLGWHCVKRRPLKVRVE